MVCRLADAWKRLESSRIYRLVRSVEEALGIGKFVATLALVLGGILLGLWAIAVRKLGTVPTIVLVVGLLAVSTGFAILAASWRSKSKGSAETLRPVVETLSKAEASHTEDEAAVLLTCRTQATALFCLVTRIGTDEAYRIRADAPTSPLRGADNDHGVLFPDDFPGAVGIRGGQYQVVWYQGGFTVAGELAGMSEIARDGFILPGTLSEWDVRSLQSGVAHYRGVGDGSDGQGSDHLSLRVSVLPPLADHKRESELIHCIRVVNRGEPGEFRARGCWIDKWAYADRDEEEWWQYVWRLPGATIPEREQPKTRIAKDSHADLYVCRVRLTDDRLLVWPLTARPDNSQPDYEEYAIESQKALMVAVLRNGSDAHHHKLFGLRMDTPTRSELYPDDARLITFLDGGSGS